MVLSSRTGWALQLPLLFLGVSALGCLGAYVALAEAITWKSLGGGLLAIALFAFTLSQRRWITVDRDKLRVRTPYGETRLALNEVALGVQVSHGGNGSPTYTIYAETNSGRFDLGTTLTRAGSARLKERLASHLLSGRLTTHSAQRSAARVAAREEKQAAQSREAARIVDDYYKKGGAKKASVLIASIVLVYCLGMGLYFWFTAK